MTMTELEFCRRHIEMARKMFLVSEGIEVSKKGDFDLVTSIDKKIETYLSEKIKENFPGDSIIGEEFKPDGEIIGRTWTIDPIDGTVNMVNGIPLTGIQLALIENNDVCFSYIYLSQLKEEYYAIKGHGTFLNGKECKVNSSVGLMEAIISFGDFSHNSVDNAKKELSMISSLYSYVSKIRMFGSAAVDFSFAASGKTSGCVVITKNLWDVLPGYLLCKESGAVVGNMDGGEYRIGDGGIIVGANRQIFNKILEAL